MFKLLDSENLGWISKEHIDFSVLDLSVLEILLPIIKRIEARNLKLTYQDFAFQIQQLDLQEKLKEFSNKGTKSKINIK